MARPKEKAVAQLGQAYQDRCKREKTRLKAALSKQLNKDIERMYVEEIFSDLTIKVASRSFQVHKFLLQTRCRHIYDKLIELSKDTADDHVLTMPEWLDTETIKLVRELYHVGSMHSEADEADLSSEGAIFDDVLLLLSQKSKPNERSVSGTNNSDHQENVGQSPELPPLDENLHKPENMLADSERTIDNHEKEQIVNDATSDSRDSSYVPLITEDSSETVNGTESCIPVDRDEVKRERDSCDVSEKWAEPRKETPELLNGTTIEQDISSVTDKDVNMTAEETESGEVVLTDVDSQKEMSLPDIIKMTYNISIPYETCNTLGEDLLRGFLQDLSYDCVVTVSDVHFKAHKCILAARSSYFAAMLSGSWMESDSSEIKLEGITPAVMEQTLLYLYGGVIELNESCTIGELVQVADMYGLEGLKDVVQLYLKKDFCHFFHKPCAVCESGVVETLQSAMLFNMIELRDKCTSWINSYFEKIWRTKAFAVSRSEVQEICYAAILSGMSILNVLDILLDCQKLNQTIPHLKWSEPVLHLVTMLMEAAIEYTSKNFEALLRSKVFFGLDQNYGHKLGLLEELFDMIIKSLPVKAACGVYQILSTQFKGCDDILSQEFLDFNKLLHSQCEDFLKLHIHQVVNTPAWKRLSKDLQSHLLQYSNFVYLQNVPQGKRPPKLTSMQRRTPSGSGRGTPTAKGGQQSRTTVNKMPDKKTGARPKVTEVKKKGSTSQGMLNRKSGKKPLFQTEEQNKKTSNSKETSEVSETLENNQDEEEQNTLEAFKSQFASGLKNLRVSKGSQPSLDRCDTLDSDIFVNIIQDDDDDVGNDDDSNVTEYGDMVIDSPVIPVPKHSVVSLMPVLNWSFTKPLL